MIKTSDRSITVNTAVCALVTAAVLVLAACTDQAEGPATQSPGEVEAQAGIHQILETWNAGDESAAMELLLAVAAAGDQAALRLFNFSERDFLNLSSTEQAAVQTDMLEQMETVRELTRHARHLGVEHAQQSQHDKAEQYADALIMFGNANTGDDQTELANAVGQAILQFGQEVQEAR